MNLRTKRTGFIGIPLMDLLTAVFAVWVGYQFIVAHWHLEGLGSYLPRWDEASHGFDGVMFAHALRDLSFSKFLHQLQLSSYWPPVYPLVEALIFLIAGEGFDVARHLAIVVSGAAIVAVAGTVVASRTSMPLAVAAMVSTLMFLNPTFTQMGVFVMLEGPGLLVLFLALQCYLHSLDETAAAPIRARAGNWTAGLGAVLFLTKYNYGIMWFIPWLGHLAIRHGGFVREISHLAGKEFRRLIKPSFFCIVTFLYAVILVAVVVTGGIDREMFGQRIIFKSVLGNPIYGFVIFVFLRYLIFDRARLVSSARFVWNAPQPWQGVIRYMATPVLIWLSYPQNFSTFFVSTINHSKRRAFFSFETLTFYPRAFLYEYSPTAWVGALVLVLFFIGLFFWRRFNVGERFIWVMGAVTFVSVVIHPNYITRYLYTAAPFLNFGAAFTLVRLFEWALEKASVEASRVGRVVLSGVIGAACFWLVINGLPAMRQIGADALAADTTRTSLTGIVDKVCTSAKDVARSTVIGYSEFLNPSVVAWSCLHQYPNLDSRSVPRTMMRLGYDPEVKDPRQAFLEPRFDLVFVFDPTDPIMKAKNSLMYFDQYHALVESVASSPLYYEDKTEFAADSAGTLRVFRLNDRK